jgi:hypothetical protein
MMNPEFKSKWIADLRSGVYKQTKSVLYDGDGYCCLGVLCKTAGAVFEDITEEDDDGECDLKYQPYLMGQALYLSGADGETLDDIGLSFFGLSANEQDTLTQMNDGMQTTMKWSEEQKAWVQEPGHKGKSFAEIADWIEENL